jgi:hypothetical protein
LSLKVFKILWLGKDEAEDDIKIGERKIPKVIVFPSQETKRKSVFHPPPSSTSSSCSLVHLSSQVNAVIMTVKSFPKLYFFVSMPNLFGFV